MNALFMGITGTSKRTALEALATEAARRRGIPDSLEDPVTKRFVRLYSIEDEIKRIQKRDTIKPFLDSINPVEQQRVWDKALSEVIKRWQNEKPDHALIQLHGYFHRHAQFHSFANWDLLRQLRPSVVVTLVDDIFDCWQRIKNAEVKYSTLSFFNLNELLAWRTAEISYAQTLARNLFPERPLSHFLFAVKHPAVSLYGLLFKRRGPVVYASFPISDTRGKFETEINTFRRSLHDAFTVLDPLAIDELRFKKRSGKIVGLLPRWQMDLGGCLVAETPLTADPLPADLDQRGKMEKDIADHIESRDYTLVGQSDCVAAYRPYFGGQGVIAGGVEKELFAAIADFKDFYMVHPKSDQVGKAVPGQPATFDLIKKAIIFETTEELIARLKQSEPGKSVTDETWE